jgi:excisionase family DNA binding protein
VAYRSGFTWPNANRQQAVVKLYPQFPHDANIVNVPTPKTQQQQPAKARAVTATPITTDETHPMELTVPPGPSDDDDAGGPLTGPDISTWPTRHEAAQLCAVSLATVDRWIAAGKITTSKRPRPGLKPEIVCNPADVRAYVPSMPAFPAYLTDSTALATTQQQPAAAAPATIQPEMFALFAHLASEIARAVSPPSRPQRFLTLEEAAQATGLTITYLRRRIKDGTLRAVNDGRSTKIRESDLAGL